MEISSNKHGDAVVLTMGGRLDTLASDEVEKQLNGALDAGEKKIVVDLAKVNYISSPGLAVFMLTWNRLRKGGGQFVVCSPSAFVKRVFEVTGFQKRVDVLPTLDEALAKVQGAPG